MGALAYNASVVSVGKPAGGEAVPDTWLTKLKQFRPARLELPLGKLCNWDEVSSAISSESRQEPFELGLGLG